MVLLLIRTIQSTYAWLRAQDALSKQRRFEAEKRDRYIEWKQQLIKDEVARLKAYLDRHRMEPPHE